MKIKENKGSIAIYVIVSFIFLVIVLLSMLAASKNAEITALKAQGVIKNVYENDIDKADEIYSKIVQSSSEPEEPDEPDEPEPTEYTYYFERPSTWESTTIYAHMWSDTTGKSTTWPGAVMTNEGNNIYSITVNVSDGYEFVSFQNGSSSQFSDATKRIVTPNVSLSGKNGKIFRGSLLQSTKTIYYEDFNNYGANYTVKTYVWKGDNNNGWPGKAATKCDFASPNSKDIYSFAIGTTYDYAIFTNKKSGSWQTGNLSVANAEGCVWRVYVKISTR